MKDCLLKPGYKSWQTQRMRRGSPSFRLPSHLQRPGECLSCHARALFPEGEQSLQESPHPLPQSVSAQLLHSPHLCRGMPTRAWQLPCFHQETSLNMDYPLSVMLTLFRGIFRASTSRRIFVCEYWARGGASHSLTGREAGAKPRAPQGACAASLQAAPGWQLGPPGLSPLCTGFPGEAGLSPCKEKTTPSMRPDLPSNCFRPILSQKEHHPTPPLSEHHCAHGHTLH